MTSRRWRGRGGAPADESRASVGKVGSGHTSRRNFSNKATNFWRARGCGCVPMKPAGKETDPLAGTPAPDIARETQRARALALVVLIASTISLIADTLLATLVGGPWGAGGVIGALGASIVLCFRSSRDGNIVYSFFLLAMLCAIIFQCFQLYATVHFWQLWVRAAPLHTEHTTLRRLTDASQAPELTGCARSPQTTGPKPPAALQAPSRPRCFAEK